uniref:Uncharacterized protein n=1 Tax=Anguilla anguilla TaxID=7936 RepID=A0A0E9RGE8_ANGAN
MFPWSCTAPQPLPQDVKEIDKRNRQFENIFFQSL